MREKNAQNVRDKNVVIIVWSVNDKRESSKKHKVNNLSYAYLKNIPCENIFTNVDDVSNQMQYLLIKLAR